MKIMNRIIMTLAGLLLILAGALKMHQMLTEPIMSKGFWESWQFNILQIPLELALGIWLLGGVFRKMAWLAGTLSFGGFCCYTLYLALGGAASCGCFGQVHVNPWITLLAIDLPLFLGLCIFWPRGEKIFWPAWPRPLHFFFVAGLAVGVLALAAPIMVIFRPPDVTDTYEKIDPLQWLRPAAPKNGQGQQTNTEPNEISIPQAQWQHLAAHIDIAEKLTDGLVLVLMYHYDCPECHKAMPEYEQYNRQMTEAGENALKIAFIAIPPYGTAEQSPLPADTTCLSGKLDESKKWFITSPVVVALLDGMAVHVWQEQAPTPDEAIDAVFSPAAGGQDSAEQQEGKAI